MVTIVPRLFVHKIANNLYDNLGRSCISDVAFRVLEDANVNEIIFRGIGKLR